MYSESVSSIINDDQTEWELLVNVLEAHPNESLHDPTSPPWTSRDVYTHLARWMEYWTEYLKAQLVGKEIAPIEGTDDEINACWQKEDSRLTLDQARQWAQRAFGQRIQTIKSVPANLWDGKLEKIARIAGAQHFTEHRNCIVVS